MIYFFFVRVILEFMFWILFMIYIFFVKIIFLFIIVFIFIWAYIIVFFKMFILLVFRTTLNFPAVVVVKALWVIGVFSQHRKLSVNYRVKPLIPLQERQSYILRPINITAKSNYEVTVSLKTWLFGVYVLCSSICIIDLCKLFWWKVDEVRWVWGLSLNLETPLLLVVLIPQVGRPGTYPALLRLYIIKLYAVRSYIQLYLDGVESAIHPVCHLELNHPIKLFPSVFVVLFQPVQEAASHLQVISIIDFVDVKVLILALWVIESRTGRHTEDNHCVWPVLLHVHNLRKLEDFALPVLPVTVNVDFLEFSFKGWPQVNPEKYGGLKTKAFHVVFNRWTPAVFGCFRCGVLVHTVHDTLVS